MLPPRKWKPEDYVLYWMESPKIQLHVQKRQRKKKHHEIFCVIFPNWLFLSLCAPFQITSSFLLFCIKMNAFQTNRFIHELHDHGIFVSFAIFDGWCTRAVFSHFLHSSFADALLWCRWPVAKIRELHSQPKLNEKVKANSKANKTKKWNWL